MPTPIAEGLTPWPQDKVDEYVSRGWWRGKTLGEELLEIADERPEAEALIDGAQRLTYGELMQRADAVATRLRALGLQAEDRLVVQLPNVWEFVVLTLACFRSGVVPVMALPAHRAHELRHLVDVAEAAAIAVPREFRGFDHEKLAHDLRTESPHLHHVLVAGTDVRDDSIDLRQLCATSADPEADRARWDRDVPSSRNVAVFLLSGGTTGLPKLIARTHDDYSYNARASAQLCGLDANTVYLGTLPIGHNFPLACPGLLGTFLVGGRVVMLPSPEPERAFRTIAAEGVTVASAVPAVAQRWLDHHVSHPSDQLQSLQLLQVGGARLADELARKIRPVLGTTLQQVFGMAEGLLNYTRLDDPDEVICTTQGRPMTEGDEVLIVDPLGDPLPDGTPGLLLTRGPYTPRGYYKAPEQNARAFTQEGWYRSGDIVRRRPDGNLVVEGRDKDMINRGGEKISAEDVENHAYRLPQVAHAAAVAMPDEILGERVCLYVVKRPGSSLSLSDVQAHLEQLGVSKVAWPERLELVDELPTTKVGKIDKAALRAHVASHLVEEAGDKDFTTATQ